MRKTEYAKMARMQSTNWWYAGRRQLICELAKSARTIKMGKLKILDVGCGTGANLSALGNIGKVVGIDYSPYAVKICKKNGFVVQKGSANKLPFASDSFDVVVLADVIEHLDDDKTAVLEAARVLRRGGMLIATVPAYPWLFSGHDQAVGHKRRYTKHELEGIFISARLKPSLVSYIFSFALGPVVFVRMLKKAANAKGSDDFSVWPPLNSALEALARAERMLLGCGVRMPFGTSIVCEAKKR